MTYKNLTYLFSTFFQAQRGHDRGRAGRAVADRGGGGRRRPLPHRHPRPPSLLLLRKRQNGQGKGTPLF